MIRRRPGSPVKPVEQPQSRKLAARRRSGRPTARRPPAGAYPARASARHDSSSSAPPPTKVVSEEKTSMRCVCAADEKGPHRALEGARSRSPRRACARSSGRRPRPYSQRNDNMVPGRNPPRARAPRAPRRCPTAASRRRGGRRGLGECCASRSTKMAPARRCVGGMRPLR